nr:MAG: polyprotein [Jingmen bat flavivirus 2]
MKSFGPVAVALVPVKQRAVRRTKKAVVQGPQATPQTRPPPMPFPVWANKAAKATLSYAKVAQKVEAVTAFGCLISQKAAELQRKAAARPGALFERGVIAVEGTPAKLAEQFLLEKEEATAAKVAEDLLFANARDNANTTGVRGAAVTKVAKAKKASKTAKAAKVEAIVSEPKPAAKKVAVKPVVEPEIAPKAEIVERVVKESSITYSQVNHAMKAEKIFGSRTGALPARLLKVAKYHQKLAGGAFSAVKQYGRDTVIHMIGKVKNQDEVLKKAEAHPLVTLTTEELISKFNEAAKGKRDANSRTVRSSITEYFKNKHVAFQMKRKAEELVWFQVGWRKCCHTAPYCLRCSEVNKGADLMAKRKQTLNKASKEVRDRVIIYLEQLPKESVASPRKKAEEKWQPITQNWLSLKGYHPITLEDVTSWGRHPGQPRSQVKKMNAQAKSYFFGDNRFEGLFPTNDHFVVDDESDTVVPTGLFSPLVFAKRPKRHIAKQSKVQVVKEQVDHEAAKVRAMPRKQRPQMDSEMAARVHKVNLEHKSLVKFYQEKRAAAFWRKDSKTRWPEMYKVNRKIHFDEDAEFKAMLECQKEQAERAFDFKKERQENYGLFQAAQLFKQEDWKYRFQRFQEYRQRKQQQELRKAKAAREYYDYSVHYFYRTEPEPVAIVRNVRQRRVRKSTAEERQKCFSFSPKVNAVETKNIEEQVAEVEVVKQASTSVRHNHECEECGIVFSHAHTLPRVASHKPGKYQCPNRNCEQFYGNAGNKRAGNYLNARIVKNLKFHVLGKVVLPMPEGWKVTTHVEYRRGGAVVFPVHAVPNDPDAKRANCDFYHRGIKVGPVTEVVFLGKPEENKAFVSEKIFDVDHSVSGRRFVQKCKRIRFSGNLLSGTPVWNAHGDLCSIITCSLNNEYYYLMNPNNANESLPTIVNSWNNSILPPGWIETDHIVYSDGENKVFPNHRVPTLFPSDNSDIHLENVELYPITDTCFIRTPRENQVSVSRDWSSVCYQVGQGMWRQYCPFIVHNELLKAGTPIWNNDNALCSIITTYQKHPRGYLYPLQNRENTPQPVEFENLFTWCNNGEKSLPMPFGWQLKGDHVEYEGTSMEGNRVRVYPIHAVQGQYEEGNSDVHVEGMALQGMGSCVALGTPNSNCRTVSSTTIKVVYRVGNRHFLRYSKWVNHDQKLVSGTPIWNENGGLVSIVTVSQGSKYLIMSKDDVVEETSEFACDWHQSDVEEGWSIENHCWNYKKDSHYLYLRHSTEEDDGGVDVVTNREFAPVTRKIFVGVTSPKSFETSSNVISHRGLEFNSFYSDKELTSGTPIWNDKFELCGVVSSSYEKFYAIETNKQYPTWRALASREGVGEHHYAGFTSPKIFKHYGKVVEVEGKEIELEGKAVTVSFFKKFLRVESGSFVNTDTKKINSRPTFWKKGNKTFFSHYENTSATFSTDGKRVYFHYKDTEHPIFFYGKLYKSKNEINRAEAVTGLHIVEKQEGGIQIQEVASDGEVLFNFHFSGEFFNSCDVMVANKEHSPLKSMLVLSTIFSLGSTLPKMLLGSHLQQVVGRDIKREGDLFEIDIQQMINIRDTASKEIKKLRESNSNEHLSLNLIDRESATLKSKEAEAKQWMLKVNEYEAAVNYIVRTMNLNATTLETLKEAVKTVWEEHKQLEHQLETKAHHLAMARKNLNGLLTKLQSYRAEIRSTTELIRTLLAFIKEADEKIQEITREVNNYFEYQSDESKNVNDMTERDLINEVNNQDVVLKSFTKSLSELKQRIGHINHKREVTTEAPFLITTSIGTCDGEVYYYENDTECVYSDSKPKYMCLSQGSHQSYKYNISTARCLCDKTFKLSAEYVTLPITDDDKDCGIESYHRCLLMFHACKEGDVTSKVADQFKHAARTIKTPSLVQTIWYLCVLALSALLMGKKGVYAGIICLLFLMSPVPAAAEECSLDGSVYEAKSETGQMWRAVGNWRVGSCIHFGNTTLSVIDIKVSQAYTLTNYLINHVNLNMKTKYGCPGGESDAICDRKIDRHDDCGFYYNECTHSYNTMWDGTNCAFNGDLFINTDVCVNVTKSSSLFQKSMTSFQITLVFKNHLTGSNITSGDDNSKVGTIKVEHVKTSKVSLAKFLILDNDALYVVKDELTIRDACTCPDKQRCVPIESRCKELSVKQQGHLVTVNTVAMVWLGSLGTSRIPKAQVTNFKDGALEEQLESIQADLVVDDRIISKLTGLCPRIDNETYSVTKGESQNYEPSIVTITTKQDECNLIVNCQNCMIVSSKNIQLIKNRATFKLMCGFSTTDTCVISSLSNSWTLDLKQLTANPTLTVNNIYDTIMQKVEDISSESGFHSIWVNVREWAKNISSYVPIHKILYYAMFAFIAWVATQFAVSGQYLFAVIIAVMALIPLASAEDNKITRQMELLELAFVTVTFFLKLINFEIYLVYLAFTNSTIALAHLLLKITKKAADIVDFFRSTYDKVANVSSVIEDVVFAILTMKNGWFISYIMLKNYRRLFSLIKFSETGVLEQEVSTNTPIVCTVAALWPKKQVDNSEVIIEYHNGEQTCVKLSFIVEQFRNTNVDRENVEILHPDTMKRIFFASYFKPGIIAVPAHAVHNDLPSFTRIHNDSLFYCTNPRGIDDIITALASSNCINYADMKCSFKPGDSGRIFWGRTGSLYIHSGVLRNGSPVCCFCGLDYTLHSDSSAAATSEVVPTAPTTSQTVVPKTAIVKKQVQMSVNMEAKTNKVSLINNKKYGVLASNHGVLTSKLAGLKITQKTAEEKAAEHKQHIERLERQVRREKQMFWDDWFLEVVGRDFIATASPGETDAQIVWNNFKDKTDILDKLYKVATNKARQFGVFLQPAKTYTQKAYYIGNLHSETKKVVLRFKQAKLEAVKNNQKPPKLIRSKDLKVATILDGTPVVVARSALVKKIPAANIPAVKHHSGADESFDAVFDIFNAEISDDGSLAPGLVYAWHLASHDDLEFDVKAIESIIKKPIQWKTVEQHLTRYLQLYCEQFYLGLKSLDFGNEYLKMSYAIQEEDSVALFTELEYDATTAYGWLSLNFLSSRQNADCPTCAAIMKTADISRKQYQEIMGTTSSQEEESVAGPSTQVDNVSIASEESIEVAVANDVSNAMFEETISLRIHDRSKFNTTKIITCPEKGDDVHTTMADETWMNDKNKTYICRIVGPTMGHGFFYGGAFRTCYHCIEKGNLVVNYYTNSACTALREENLLAPKASITLTSTETKTIPEGDYATFSVVPKPKELVKPKNGENFICIDIERRCFFTIRHKGTKTLKNGKIYDIFAHVDLTKPEGEQTIPIITNLKGASGTPILNKFGHPVSTWGTSTITSTNEGDIEVTLAKARGCEGVSFTKIDTTAIYKAFMDLKETGRILRLQGATGSGKTTRLPLALAQNMYLLKKRQVKVYVLIPQRVACDMAYEFVSEQVFKQNLNRKVEIACEHGALVDQSRRVSSWNYSHEPEIVITYKTYGSAVFALQQIQAADLVLLDEIHQKDNSQVQAVMEFVKDVGLNNCIALTATPYTGEALFVDNQLPSHHPHTIEDNEMISFMPDDSGKLPENSSQYYLFNYPVSSNNHYGVKKSFFKLGFKTIVFLPTKKDCAIMSEAIKKNYSLDVAVFTSEQRDEITETCMIFATDVIESSATIPGVNNIIDFRLVNRPNVILEENGNGYFYSHNFEIRPVNECQAKQRRGRTGRTCDGTYHFTAARLSTFDPFPRAACTEAAILLIAAGYEQRDKDPESNVTTKTFFRVLSPRNNNIRRVYQEQNETSTEFENRMQRRAQQSMDFNKMPNVAFYLSKHLPAVVERFPHTFGEPTFTDSWKVDKKNLIVADSEIIDSHSAIEIDLECDFYNVFKNVNVSNMIKNRQFEDENTVKEIFKNMGNQRFLDGIVAMETNSYTQPLMIALASIGAGSYIAWHLKTSIYGDRTVSKIVEVPCRDEYDDKIWNVIQNFDYCDQEYHKNKALKVSEMAKTLFRKGGKSIKNLCYNIVKASGNDEFIQWFEARFYYNLNSSSDWLEMIDAWCKTLITQVQNIDLSSFENLGVISIFPAIALFFNTCSEKYGELVTTIGTSIFSVWANMLLGNQFYMISTGATLLINVIRNSLFLNEHDVDYSKNLALSMVAIPFGASVLRKLFEYPQTTQMLQNTVNSVTVQQAATTVAHSGNILMYGTGGADSGFANAMLISSMLKNGLGESGSEKAESIFTIIVRTYNISSLDATGLTTMGVTVCADLVISWFLSWVEKKTEHEADHIKDKDIATDIYRSIRDDKKDKIKLFRTLYDMAKIIVGCTLNPWNIPFMATSIAVRWIQFSIGGNALGASKLDEFIRIAQRQLFVSPIFSAVNMAYQTYSLMSAGIDWTTQWDDVRNTAASVLYRVNSEQASIPAVISIAKEMILSAWDSIKDFVSALPGSCLIRYFSAILKPIAKIINAIARGFSKTIETVKLTLRDVFITTVCPDFIAEWMMKKPQIRKTDVQVEVDSDTEHVLKTLNRYGLNAISNYIAAKIQKESNYNVFSIWTDDNNLNYLRYYNTLQSLVVQANGTAIAAQLNTLPVNQSLTLSKITRGSAVSFLREWAMVCHYKIAKSIKGTVQKEDLNAILNKSGILVLTSIIKEDLIVLFSDVKTAKWSLLFMSPGNADCWMLTTDNTEGIIKDMYSSCTNAFLRKLYLEQQNKKSDIKTKTYDYAFIDRYHEIHKLVDCYVAHILEGDGQQIGKAIKLSCHLSPIDHLIVNENKLPYIVRAKLALCGSSSETYAEHLNFTRDGIDMEEFKELKAIDSLPANKAKLEVININFLTTSLTDMGIELYFLRVLTPLMQTEDFITALNIVTGKHIYFEDENRKVYVQNRFSTPGNENYLEIRGGMIYEAVVGKGTLKPLPFVTVKELNRYLNVDKHLYKGIDPDGVGWFRKLGEESIPLKMVNRTYRRNPFATTLDALEDFKAEMDMAGKLQCPPTSLQTIVFCNDNAKDTCTYLPLIYIQKGLKLPETFGKAFSPVTVQLSRVMFNSIVDNNSLIEETPHIIVDEVRGFFTFVQKPIAEAIRAMHGQILGFHVVENKKNKFEEYADFAVKTNSCFQTEDLVNFPSEVNSFVANVEGGSVEETNIPTITIRRPHIKCDDLSDLISKKAFCTLAHLPECNQKLKIPIETVAPTPTLIVPCLIGNEAQRVVHKYLDVKRRNFMDKKEKQFLEKIKKSKFSYENIERYEEMEQLNEIVTPYFDQRKVSQWDFKDHAKKLEQEVSTTYKKMVSLLSPKNKKLEDPNITVAEIHAEPESSTSAEIQFNTNSKDDVLGNIINWLRRRNNLVSSDQVKRKMADADLTGIKNKEIMAHDLITKDVAKAIYSVNQIASNTIMLDLPYLVHFDRVSNRRMNYNEGDSLKEWLKPTIKDNIPLGTNIEWATEQTLPPTAIRVTDADCQRVTSSLDGFLKGHEWEVMKRKDRVWLPQNEDLGTPSKGFMKAAQLDRDTQIFSTSQKVLDLSSGAGGFEYYLAHCKPKPGREVVFTTLTRPGHVNFNYDVFAGIDPRTFRLKKIEHGNGDFRYKGVFEIAKKQMPCGFDLLILDCGESSSRLDKEGNWMYTKHTVEKINKYPVIDQRPAYAIEKYISLVQTGGSAVIKIMGYTEGSRKFVRQISQHFRKLICYKMPTSSYTSREWYLVCTGKRQQPASWPHIDKIIDHAKYVWLHKANEFHDWAKSNVKTFTADLRTNGPVGFGLGLAVSKKTMHDVEKRHGHLNSHCHACAVCGNFYVHAHDYKHLDHRHEFTCPRKTCGNYWGNRYAEDKYHTEVAYFNYKDQVVKHKPRPLVPVYSYTWRNPSDNNNWIKLGPQAIEERIKENTIQQQYEEYPYPNEWTCFGETFNFQIKERAEVLKHEIKRNGYHILPPSQKFEKIYEPFRISFKEKYGKEKHTSNMLIGDMMFNVFGLTPATSVIGHTQCTKDLLDAAHKKRLDLNPKEPNEADKKILMEAAIASCTPEYWRIANGPDSKKFEHWDYDTAVKYINNQGAGGHFDKWTKFKDAVIDPEFKKQVLKRVDDLKNGRPVATYQTCRDKRETKAKKNIMSDGRLKIDESHDATNPAYLRLNAQDKKVRREARTNILYGSANISPRNIRYSEFVQRFVDLMLLGPYQQHHNNKEKMYMGSTTGTPLWKLGDLLRSMYEIYTKNDEKEFILGDKIIEKNRKKFSKEFLSAHDKRNVKIELFSDAHSTNVLKRIEQAVRHQIASGDFSGWDGTVNNTDHANEYVHLKRVYKEKDHAFLKNRMCLYMVSFTITDNGHVVCGWGQRGSGDQQTSSGNTYHNDILHVAATAISQGKTCADVCKIIGVIHYKASFDKEAKWKKYYVREMCNVADGDDNNHFAEERLIQLLNTSGVQFIERCGKAIRCGTRSGYDINTKFEDLSYCSHTFTRVRKAVTGSKLYVSKQFNNTSIVAGERPKRWGEAINYEDPLIQQTYEMLKDESLSAEWTLVHQRIYDALNDVIVTYLPLRNLPEIVGKLTYTIKNEVLSFHFNRKYDNTNKGKKEALKNERAIEITRGKALAYLLNYIHIESVRVLVGGIMSIIGDGACDMTTLSKRYHVPSSVSSVHSAMKSVFEIESLDQIETIARHYDSTMLKNLNYNARQQFETCRFTTPGGQERKIGPRSIPELSRAVQAWVTEYCFKHQLRPDAFFFSMTQLTEERKQAPTKEPVRTKTIKKSILIDFWLKLFAVVQITQVVIVKSDLSDLPPQLKSIEIQLRKKLVFTPTTGQTIDFGITRFIFVKHLSKDEFVKNKNIIKNLLNNAPTGSVLIPTKSSRTLKIRVPEYRRNTI